MSRVSLLLLLSSLLVWSGALAYRNVFSQSRGSWRSTLLNADTESGVVDAVNGDDKILDIINAPIDDVKLDVISAVKSLADAIKQPDGTSYIMCSSCKTAYVMSESEVDKKGVRVRCGVCEKEWYQTSERLLKTDMNNILSNMTETKVVELKAAINAQQWPKNPKVDKIGVFIGNLPYTYTEKELGEIFAEYGVTGISLVRDAEQNSKGFAFIEVASQDDADLMIKEMHHYYTDSQRKLTVRIAQPPSKDNAPRAPAGGDRNQGRQPFSNAGGNAGGKEWKPRK